MATDLTYVIMVVLVLVIIIQNFINSRQINLAQVNQLIDRLAPKVAETPTPVDDIALQVATILLDRLSEAGVPSVPSATAEGEVSPS